MTQQYVLSDSTLSDLCLSIEQRNDVLTDGIIRQIADCKDNLRHKFLDNKSVLRDGPLELAISTSQYSVVIKLLNAGANLHKNFFQAFLLLCSRANPEIVGKVINFIELRKKDDAIIKGIIGAISTNNINTLRYLFDNHYPYDEIHESFLVEAIYHNNHDTLKILLSYNKNQKIFGITRALETAIERKKDASFKIIYEFRTKQDRREPSKENINLMIMAILFNNVVVTEYLLNELDLSDEIMKKLIKNSYAGKSHKTIPLLLNNAPIIDDELAIAIISSMTKSMTKNSYFMIKDIQDKDDDIIDEMLDLLFNAYGREQDHYQSVLNGVAKLIKSFDFQFITFLFHSEKTDNNSRLKYFVLLYIMKYLVGKGASLITSEKVLGLSLDDEVYAIAARTGNVRLVNDYHHHHHTHSICSFTFFLAEHFNQINFIKRLMPICKNNTGDLCALATIAINKENLELLSVIVSSCNDDMMLVFSAILAKKSFFNLHFGAPKAALTKLHQNDAAWLKILLVRYFKASKSSPLNYLQKCPDWQKSTVVELLLSL